MFMHILGVLRCNNKLLFMVWEFLKKSCYGVPKRDMYNLCIYVYVYIYINVYPNSL